jgi:hypothetical protein
MADQGFGHSITFDSGFFAEILSTSFSGWSRESIDTTHSLTTGGKMTFMASDLIDAGGLEVEIAFAPNSRPPIDDPAESCTITFPIPTGGSSAATWVATAFMTNFTPSIPIDARMTANCTLKFSGDITVTAGS